MSDFVFRIITFNKCNMEKIQNIQQHLSRMGKNNRFVQAITLLLVSAMFSSCEIIGDIFKAGLWVGIIIVLAIIFGIIYIFRRIGRKP